MLERIEQLGPLVSECTLAGETKADGRCPGHGNVIALSRDRWLLMYCTRATYHTYDTRSVIYQLRAESPVGPVIREGSLGRFEDLLEPYGDGRLFHKEHGNIAGFGVPKGALVAGRRAPHANLFVARWFFTAVEISQGTPLSPAQAPRPKRLCKVIGTEWMQFRLNDREDDIEIIQPARLLRQVGCEEGEAVGHGHDGEPLEQMSPGILNPLPANDARTAWAEISRFDDRFRAAVEYRYNHKTRLYEWVRTGPAIQPHRPRIAFGWTSLVRTPEEWIVVAHKTALTWPVRPPNVGAEREGLDPDEMGVAWMRSRDPWRGFSPPLYPPKPSTYCSPVTAYLCADGVLRLFGGDQTLCEPPRGRRNPLWCWDIDPDRDFVASEPRLVYDAFDVGIRLRPRSVTEPEVSPAADKAKLVTHAGGNEQYLIHPVTLLPEESAAAGLYHQKLLYDRDYPAEWTFE